MVQAASYQLDFYLIEKGESDPWRYAIYHCRTGGYYVLGNLLGVLSGGDFGVRVAMILDGEILRVIFVFFK